MKKSYLLILILFAGFPNFAQDTDSKQEFTDYWKNHKIKQRDSLLNIEGNSHGQIFFLPKIREQIEYLINQDIDTIGVFMKDYIGFASNDSCDCDIDPWTGRIFWIDKKILYSQDIQACCVSVQEKNDSIEFFQFFSSNKEKINQEVIFPVVKSIKRHQNGKISPIVTILNHDINYSIFCKYGQDKTYLSFDLDEIENEISIYHIENRNSQINLWRKLIEKKPVE